MLSCHSDPSGAWVSCTGVPASVSKALSERTELKSELSFR
jgi:hypothetical protein